MCIDLKVHGSRYIGHSQNRVARIGRSLPLRLPATVVLDARHALGRARPTCWEAALARPTWYRRYPIQMLDALEP